MMLQLNPPLPVETPKGKAQAHFLIDYGPEQDLFWVTFDDATGECWTWPNPRIRAQQNITLGRMPVKLTPAAEATPPAPANGAGNGRGAH